MKRLHSSPLTHYDTYRIRSLVRDLFAGYAMHPHLSLSFDGLSRAFDIPVIELRAVGEGDLVVRGCISSLPVSPPGRDKWDEGEERDAIDQDGEGEGYGPHASDSTEVLGRGEACGFVMSDCMYVCRRSRAGA